jgi:hypothetical protein
MIACSMPTARISLAVRSILACAVAFASEPPVNSINAPSFAACLACSAVSDVGAAMPWVATMLRTPSRLPSSNINSAS